MATAKETPEKKTEKPQSLFEQLLTVDVGDKIEKKDAGKDKNGKPIKLSYLSWAWAWAEAKKRCPDLNYEIVKQENGLPYVYDPKTGYMVYTRVTTGGQTYDMWLPVMDGNNRAMKAEPYGLTFKNGNSITVQPATMMEINKTIMRCLVKNIAVATGLGLYIYAGEDIPEAPEEATRSFICAACGGTFTDEATANLSMDRWKKHICPDCIRKKQEEVKKKKEEAAKKKAEEEAAKRAEVGILEMLEEDRIKAAEDTIGLSDLPFPI